MKRVQKNVFIVFLMLVLLLLSFFTMKNAKDNLILSDNEKQLSEDFSKKEMPQMSENTSGENQKILPENREGETSKEMQEKPPKRPYEENKLDDNRDAKNNDDVKLTTVYYILFSFEAILFSILLVYLLMSNFSKKSFRETLVNKKIIIYPIFVAMIFVILTFVQINVTNGIFLKFDDSSVNED